MKKDPNSVLESERVVSDVHRCSGKEGATRRESLAQHSRFLDRAAALWVLLGPGGSLLTDGDRGHVSHRRRAMGWIESAPRHVECTDE